MKKVIKIGRAEDNEIVVSKLTVNKHHAQLIFEDAKILLEDLNSLNGTYVNGERISGQIEIGPNDLVTLADNISIDWQKFLQETSSVEDLDNQNKVEEISSLSNQKDKVEPKNQGDLSVKDSSMLGQQNQQNNFQNPIEEQKEKISFEPLETKIKTEKEIILEKPKAQEVTDKKEILEEKEKDKKINQEKEKEKEKEKESKKPIIPVVVKPNPPKPKEKKKNLKKDNKGVLAWFWKKFLDKLKKTFHYKNILRFIRVNWDLILIYSSIIVMLFLLREFVS